MEAAAEGKDSEPSEARLLILLMIVAIAILP